jgi:hypothetical protein
VRSLLLDLSQFMDSRGPDRRGFVISTFGQKGQKPMRSLSATKMILGAAACLALAQPAQATVRNFFAFITHDQEPGGVPDEGSSGVGLFTLNDDNPSAPFLTYDVHLSGLDIDGNQTPANVNDNVTRTHFHNAAFGVNGGIVFGQIDAGQPTLRNDLDDLQVDPVAGTIKGVWDNAEGNATTLAQQIAGGAFNTDANGRTNIYFNVHTTDHGGGEIRGQLTVPEPTSAALVGLLCVLGARRRRA